MNIRHFFFAAVLGVVAVNAVAVPVARAEPFRATKATAVDSAPESEKGKGKGKDVYFKNCSAARAAGYSDMLKGEAGYAPHLDRDKDGIACETTNWTN